MRSLYPIAILLAVTACTEPDSEAPAGATAGPPATPDPQ